MFWRTVVRDSDDATRITQQGPWARTADVINGTNRMLATGASWSGHERNHLFFGGLPNHQFERLSGISGLDDPGDSRAFATLDFDHDGWLDIALVNVSAPRLRLMRNEIGERPASSGNGFVAVRFVGGNQGSDPTEQWSTRDGLGTYVEFDLDNGDKVYREHRIDDGFKAQNTATMIVGIGRHDMVRSLKIRWLSGREQSTSNIHAGTLITVYENPDLSPTGEPFVLAPYRETAPGMNRTLAASGDDWQSRLLPLEPSRNSLVLPGATSRIAETDSRLALYTTMATWCVACATEVPELQALRAAFSESELAMFALPIDEKDTPSKLQSWIDNLNPPYELLIGLAPSEVKKAKDVFVAELRDAGRVPATIVTDSEGRVLLARWDVPSISELRKLLSEKRRR